jgi:hypothetical protein
VYCEQRTLSLVCNRKAPGHHAEKKPDHDVRDSLEANRETTLIRADRLVRDYYFDADAPHEPPEERFARKH